MGRWRLLGLILCYVGGGECEITHASASTPIIEEDSSQQIESHKKKKSRELKRQQSKSEGYSEQAIERLLENDSKDGVCNRLNCASSLEIAKSCLKTKASHRKNRKCFHAFCAYGCNDGDYETNPDVYDFCNLTCSSKKYVKK